VRLPSGTLVGISVDLYYICNQGRAWVFSCWVLHVSAQRFFHVLITQHWIFFLHVQLLSQAVAINIATARDGCECITGMKVIVYV